MKHTPRVIAKFGGRFIVRGAEIHALEGPPEPRRLVVIEFPSLDQARAFHASEDYAAVKTLREGAGEGQFLAVDGFAPAAWAEMLAASQALAPTD
jgi:uncharacterized protein (DUF1330 family)